jgi:hypothetical protein
VILRCGKAGFALRPGATAPVVSSASPCRRQPRTWRGDAMFLFASGSHEASMPVAQRVHGLAINLR